MSEPILSFIYNHGSNDSMYLGSGEANGDYKLITVTVSGGATPDTLVFTGGGINAFLPTPTATYGAREATIRPVSNALTIPQAYVESELDNIMYNVPLAGKNTNRYVFGVYVDGEITSDLYLEAWDDDSFSTTVSPVLAGTTAYPHSMINALRTTASGWANSDWTGATASGTSQSNYLKGYDNRVRLAGGDSTINSALYYNMYVSLPYDAGLFHGTPVLSFRYLYV